MNRHLSVRYASPELGRPMAAYLSGVNDADDERQVIRVSKSMDVWALGILISKIVLGKNISSCNLHV